MGAEGTFRDCLGRIHDMGPLTPRERELARMVVAGFWYEGDIIDVLKEPQWWGAKAVATVRDLFGDIADERLGEETMEGEPS